MTEKPKTIHRKMAIEQILSAFPQKAQRLAQEMADAGLQCTNCQAATWETLEVGMISHGMGDAMIDGMVERLNVILAEESDLTTITITERAATKYAEILAEEGKQGWGLRFAEKMSGCNGFEYLLDYSEKASESDETFTSRGIPIHIEKGMVPRLLGSEIDYLESLQSSGFKVSNPNVRSACGCGVSHGY